MDNSGAHQWRWHPVFRDYYMFKRRGNPGTTSEHDLIWARSMLGDEQPSAPPVAQPPSFTQQDAFPSLYLASSPNLHGQINNIPQNNPLDSSNRVNNSSPPPLYGMNPSLPSGSASVISITDPRTATPATTNDTPTLPYPGPNIEQSPGQYVEKPGRAASPFILPASPSIDAFITIPDGYELIRNPRAYFKKGRIFKVLWPEPKGELGSESSMNTTTETIPLENDGRSVSTALHIKARMFVVVRPRPQHCLCLPVYTYSQQGTSKAGIKAEDHAPLIQDNTLVEYHPGEEQGKLRKSILLILEDSEMHWSPLSRINLSQIQTVQYNLKVRTVGRVLPDCLPDLEGLFREAVGLGDD